jgi:hypothetical protein
MGPCKSNTAPSKSTNVDLQRMMQSPLYKLIFPNTRVGLSGWQCNTSLIEYAGRFGSFRNTTTMGSINGMELHLGVISRCVFGLCSVQRMPLLPLTQNQQLGYAEHAIPKRKSVSNGAQQQT